MKNLLKQPLFLFFLALSLNLVSTAQVHIDKSIRFVPPSGKTIDGIVLNMDSTSGVPYSAFLETDLNYISATDSGSVLNIALPVTIAAYPDGLELYIKLATSNSGKLFLNVNGLGSVEVKKADTISLVANEITPGQIVKVIYNTNYFVLQTQTNPACPSGFVSANANFCIEKDARTAAAYLNAISMCYSLNARLCTWGEWYYACQKTALGLLNMTSNYEYVDDTSDHSNTVLLVGGADCKAVTTFTLPGGNKPFKYRCCYSK